MIRNKKKVVLDTTMEPFLDDGSCFCCTPRKISPATYWVDKHVDCTHTRKHNPCFSSHKFFSKLHTLHTLYLSDDNNYVFNNIYCGGLFANLYEELPDVMKHYQQCCKVSPSSISKKQFTFKKEYEFKKLSDETIELRSIDGINFTVDSCRFKHQHEEEVKIELHHQDTIQLFAGWLLKQLHYYSYRWQYIKRPRLPHFDCLLSTINWDTAASNFSKFSAIDCLCNAWIVELHEDYQVYSLSYFSTKDFYNFLDGKRPLKRIKRSKVIDSYEKKQLLLTYLKKVNKNFLMKKRDHYYCGFLVPENGILFQNFLETEEYKSLTSCFMF